jgi:hypothetical protein
MKKIIISILLFGSFGLSAQTKPENETEKERLEREIRELESKLKAIEDCTEEQKSAQQSNAAGTRDTRFYPVPDTEKQKEIYDILNADYNSNTKDMFSADGHLTLKYLEDTFNKYYGLTDEKGKNTVTIEWPEEGRRNTLWGESQTNKVILNKNMNWTNEELINTVAHEYYHAQQRNIENKKKDRIEKLKISKTEWENYKAYWENKGYLADNNAAHNKKNKDEKIAEAKKNLDYIEEELSKEKDKLSDLKSKYHAIPDDCYDEQGKFIEAGDQVQTCKNHQSSYVNSEEEHEARVLGESAAAAFRNFREKHSDRIKKLKK